MASLTEFRFVGSKISGRVNYTLELMLCVKIAGGGGTTMAGRSGAQARPGWVLEPDLDPVDEQVRRRRWRVLRAALPPGRGLEAVPQWVKTPDQFIDWLSVRLSAAGHARLFGGSRTDRQADLRSGTSPPSAQLSGAALTAALGFPSRTERRRRPQRHPRAAHARENRDRIWPLRGSFAKQSFRWDRSSGTGCSHSAA